MSLRYPSGFISAGYDPLKTPNAPTIGTASIASATSVSVTFTAPSNVGGGAITSYTVVATKTSDGTTVVTTGSSSPVTITGLTTDSAYTVTVFAVNIFGSSPSSAASNSVTPVVQQQLWAWGRNNGGQLGLNDTVNISSPVQVGALTTWSQVSSGFLSTVAVKMDGTLWAWGVNDIGQLGLNNTTNCSSPVQVGALTTWYEVVTGGQPQIEKAFCVAIKTNGTMWSWGQGKYGQLGLGVGGLSENKSSPVQVGALTTWAAVAASSPGFCLAIKNDGTLWAWGYNFAGTLGQNDTIARSSPVQVGSSADWESIAGGSNSSFAIKTNGTLWSWGSGSDGQLGLNNTANRSSPVQIGALTTWSKITASNGGLCVALKDDGTMWSWGANSLGALGQNNTITRSSPVQIGALTTWTQVSLISNSCFAIKTDGTMWSWGQGSYGRLGLNTYGPNQSSPVQVGALTTWLALGKNSGSANHMMALRAP